MKRIKNWINSGFRPKKKAEKKLVAYENCEHFWSKPREHVMFANAQERMCKHCETIQQRYSDGSNRWSGWKKAD